LHDVDASWIYGSGNTTDAVVMLALALAVGGWLYASKAYSQELPVSSQEIHPTHDMLKQAIRYNCDVKHYCPTDNLKYDYHFRKMGPHVLWCSYVEGGNGGFCQKITNRTVLTTDAAAREYCAGPYGENGTAPHAIYGELYDLDYRCVGKRMSRLPVSEALDQEGYVRTQWTVLP
jgi:hypothetical protein